ERAQAPQPDPELVHAFAVLAQTGAGLVGADLLNAGTGGGRKGGARRHVVPDGHRLGALRRRRLVSGQTIAARRLGIVFPGHRDLAVEGEGEFDQATRLTRLQLQLDLANSELAVGGPDFAAIERYLDARVIELHRPYRAAKFGREDRGQVCDNYVIVKERRCSFIAKRRQFRHVVRDGSLDFLIGLQSAGVVSWKL